MGQSIITGETAFQNFTTYLISPLYQLAAVCAFLYFLYGAFKFIVDLNDPTKKNTGKSHLLWGLVGLFIIFSLGGLLPILNKLIGGMFIY